MVLDETETPLVLVHPTDRAESVLERARNAGAPRVQLLVPEGVTALQQPEEVARLARLAADAGIALVLISSDPATLAAARIGNIPTVTVSGAQVLASPQVPRPNSPYSTRVLEQARTAPADAAYRIDELDAPLPGPNRSADEEAAAAASLAAALREADAPRPAMTDDELLAATLAAEPGLTPPRVARPARPAEPQPYGQEAPPRPAPRPAPRPTPAPAPRRATATRAAGRPPAVAPAARPNRTWLIVGLSLGLLVLLGLLGGALLWNSRVTVTVTPPERPETIEPITSLPVPIVAPGSGTATAVEAESLRSDVAFAVEGQVSDGTMTPSGSAGGSLTIFNSTPQAVQLPAGTEFIAIAGDGREVPFVSVGDVLVPGATTSDTGAQVITSRGQASVQITARSPGSGSNVDGNTVRRVIPPGGGSFNVDTGGIIVQHGPLTGGSEEEVRIVKDSNVQALLAPALEGLDSEARRQLDGLARARGLTLAETTIRPRRADLEQLQGFEYSVQPAVGETLDPTNPRFSLQVQSTYSGLGVPADRPLDQQLGPVLTEQLLQAGRITAGDCRAPAVTNWRWDGERLLVDGQISPDTLSPGCQGGLEPEALEQVRAAVIGKPRAEAQAALDALVAQGVIGGYTLPDVQRLPGWDWQLTVKG
jgi:hypothetical protein